jgi:pantoate--beta-alanine ligase
VVLKLFNLVQPDVAFFGQKDAQQSILLRKMTRDLNLGVEIIVCPIVRESDGLAKSSRNRYLNAAERQAALVLYQSLQWAKTRIMEGETRAAVICEEIKTRVGREALAHLDYVEMIHPDDLTPVPVIGNEEVLLALAVFIGSTRLIDNMLIKAGGHEMPLSFERH